MNPLITLNGVLFCAFGILAVLVSLSNVGVEGCERIGQIGALISGIVIFGTLSSLVPDFIFGQFLKSTLADALFITIITVQIIARKRVFSSLRNLLHSLLHIDDNTRGQIWRNIVWIALVLLIVFAIDRITSMTGWIVPFFVISIVLLVHSIFMGIGVIVRPVKFVSGSNSPAAEFLAWKGPLKVNTIAHLLASLSDGLYFLFAASLFLKFLYLLSGGFSHATASYWDWLSFVLYLIIDQVCFGLISTFLGILHVTFTSIQATQPLQQWAVYVPGVVFALLFWLAFLKFLKMLINKGTQKISAHPEDQILRPSVVFQALVSPCIVSGFALILILGLEWLVSFTRRAELGLIISAAVLSFFIIPFVNILFRIPPEEFVSIFAKVGSSKRRSSRREGAWTATSLAIATALLYLILAAAIFQWLSLLFGGFSPAAASYWDWLSFLFYSALDQVLFNIVSIFHLYHGPIQATQTLQQLMVFVFINLLFALLFWGSVLKFCWPMISTTLKEKELTDVDIF